MKRSPHLNERPHVAQAGDSIAWNLLPGVALEVLAGRPCTVTVDCPEPHDMYAVRDPLGDLDWLCGYTVHPIEEGPSR